MYPGISWYVCSEGCDPGWHALFMGVYTLRHAASVVNLTIMGEIIVESGLTEEVIVSLLYM